MYSILIYIYIAGIKLAALCGHRKAKLMIEGHKNIFPLLSERLRDGVKYFWFHVSSLGEFEQGRPIIERLRETHHFSLPRATRQRKSIRVPMLSVICLSIHVATWRASLIS